MGTAEHEVSREPGSPRRPLLGLRRKPGRFALAVFRMPLRAYRHDAGWLLGRTFMEFVHTGRKTGKPYETVAMVLRYDPDAHEAVICACGARTPTGCATCAPGGRPGRGSGASRFPRSTGSCPIRRPSTSLSSSAASTHGGYG